MQHRINNANTWNQKPQELRGAVCGYSAMQATYSATIGNALVQTSELLAGRDVSKMRTHS